MKTFFLKNIKHKITALAICAALYIILILLSNFTPLGKTYMFSWSWENLYWLNWVIVAVMIILNALPAAYILSAGNFVGVFLGHFIGGPLDEWNLSQITPDMPPEVAGPILCRNYQWGTWFMIVLLSIGAGILVNAILRAQKRADTDEEMK